MAITKYRKEENFAKIIRRFNKAKAAESMKAIAKNKKIYEKLFNLCDKIKPLAKNGKIKEAQKLIETTFKKNPQLKRIVSREKITKLLKNKNNFPSFSDKLKGGGRTFGRVLAGALRFTEAIEKLIALIKSMERLKKSSHKVNNSNNLSKLQLQIAISAQSAHKMEVFFDSLNLAVVYFPIGFKEITELYIDIFKASKKFIVKIGKKRADKLDEYL